MEVDRTTKILTALFAISLSSTLGLFLLNYFGKLGLDIWLFVLMGLTAILYLILVAYRREWF